MFEKSLEYYISKSLDLAKKGIGKVSPNPMVGAVIVKNGKIIGEGYHQEFGKPHAEVNAIDSAKESVRNGTLYCNLEPCCHTNKKTPPCAQRIIKEGISKVVISNNDPNPEVNGKGIQLLRNAGIEVITGVLEEEGEKLNRFFFKHVKTRLPYVTVKIAQTLDGKIAAEKNKQTWITCEESQKLVHRWRSEYDAVLIGANTVLIDNPQLSVRKIKGRNPKRVIIDGNLRISEKSQVLKDINPNEILIFTKASSNENKIDDFRKRGFQIITMPDKNEKIKITEILAEIGQAGINSLLVEGGNQIFSQFILSGLFDELKVFIAPKLFGSGIPGLSGLINTKLKLLKHQKIDKDLLLTYAPYI